MKIASISKVARVLNDAHVPCIVVGGVAVVAHGYGRQTQDLDLVIRLEPSVIRHAFAALATLGYKPVVPVTVEMFASATLRAQLIAEKAMTVLHFHSEQHPETPIDLFASEPFDFDSEFAAATIEHAAPGVPLRIVRLKTLLHMKRQVGRPQDLADIAELSRIHQGRTDG